MPTTFEEFEASVLRGRAQRSERTARGTLRAVPTRGTPGEPVAYTLGRLALTRAEAMALFPIQTGDEAAVAEIRRMGERELLDLVVDSGYLGDPYYATFAKAIRDRHAELVAARGGAA